MASSGRLGQFVVDHRSGLGQSCAGLSAVACALELEDTGVLAHFGVRVLGTPLAALRDLEEPSTWRQKVLRSSARVVAP